MLITAEDFVKKDDFFYFVSKDINIICRIDINSYCTEIVDCIPEEKLLEKRLCSKIISWKNELIFVPMNAKKIWRYNIENGRWHGIDLNEYEDRKDKIFQAILYEDKLFMVGCSIPAIIELNLITEQLEILKEPFTFLASKKKNDLDACFRCDYVQQGTKIILASCLDNTVIMFDIKTKQVDMIKVGDKNNRYSGIAWDGKWFWLSPRYNSSIVKWNGKNEIFEYPLHGIVREKCAFLGAVFLDDHVIIPGRANYITNHTIIISNERQIALKDTGDAYYFFKKNSDFAVSMDAHGIWNIKGAINKTFSANIDRIELLKFLKNKKGRNNVDIFGESQEFFSWGVKELLEVIPVICPLQIVNGESNYGDKIWNVLKRNV